MNRHVAAVDVGRRLFSSLASPSATSPFPQLPLVVALRPLQSPIASSSRPFARSISSASCTSRHAPTQNTRLRWPASQISVTAQLGLRRDFHVQTKRNPLWLAGLGKNVLRREFSDKKISGNHAVGEGAQRTAQNAARPDEASTRTKESTAAGFGSRAILERLPHLHRPSKEDFLAAATGFWHRLGIHFKWFSIRSMRPFNHDDIGAFLSWIFWGHVLWVVIGTTTFVSLLVWAVNTVFAQETLAGWVGNYLTKSSGIKVVFESAIVPKWKGGVITFQNVFVSRRPGGREKGGRTVSKGSSTTAAAAAAEAALAEKRDIEDPADDGNYTQFDVTIDTVNVSLSFAKWFNGKGLLRDVEIHGVRGVIDRTNVRSSDEYVDPKTYRHEHHPGDFEIDEFTMEDVLLTVYQPRNFRPFTVSVFSCELPRLRKQWLFYDFMCANNMSGSFDESLFTLHPRQVHGHTGVRLDDGMDEEGSEWKKHSRLRIDGLKIDHLNRGVEGPFSWIQEGNVDIVADVMIPNDGDNIWDTVLSGIHDSIDRMEATVTNSQIYSHAYNKTSQKLPDESQASADEDADTTIQQSDNSFESVDVRSSSSPSSMTSKPDPNDRFLVLDMRIQLNDVRASVPLFNKDLNYVNNALVRPIVAYINSRRAFIPINCRVVKRQSEFDGSWTVFDSGLLDDVSRETYDAFARDIVDSQARKRRIKKVGLWTLQVAAQALFIGLAGQLA